MSTEQTKEVISNMLKERTCQSKSDRQNDNRLKSWQINRNHSFEKAPNAAVKFYIAGEELKISYKKNLFNYLTDIQTYNEELDKEVI